MVLVYCEDRLLFVRRGCEPYSGKWAPPGGFVECHESVEAAAARELWEETQLKLDTTQLLPKGVLSITHINQVYHVFVAYLDEPQAVVPVPPESVDVRWFSQANCTAADADIRTLPPMWTTSWCLRSCVPVACDVFQWNDDYRRIIFSDGQIQYPWRRDEASRS